MYLTAHYKPSNALFGSLLFSANRPTALQFRALLAGTQLITYLDVDESHGNFSWHGYNNPAPASPACRARFYMYI